MKEIDFRHTIVGQGLLWFGAAISIAEIVTGMQIMLKRNASSATAELLFHF